MNYLAHLLLSGEDEDLIIGNFIADGLKPGDKDNLSESVLRGVQLHYLIDDFTDEHPIVLKSKRRLFEKYHHYSAVIIDLFYDHFLAINWVQYSNVSLRDYANQSYELLETRKSEFPYKSTRFLDYMIRYDVLYNYSTIEGMSLTLKNFSGRAQKNSKIEESPKELISLHKEFNDDFMAFFPELVGFCEESIKIL